MIKLVKMDPKYKRQLFEMMDEWSNANEKIIPWSIRKVDYHDIDNYINSLEVKEPYGKYVPDSTFFCLDTDRNIFIGAVNIRHYLNDELIQGDGHIGDGIRPSERGKGYGNQIVKLTIDECHKMGINEILICCDKDNIISAKTIVHNGGVLENEIDIDGIKVQRYWIKD